MDARRSRASLLRVLVGVLSGVVVGCATILGVDFDVTARRTSAGAPRVDSGEGPSELPSWRIESPDGQTQLLGLSVAVEGDTILAGARDEPDWRGRVYVVTRNFDRTWQVADTLTAQEFAVPNAQFGSSVALSGDWAIVGAKGGRSVPGAAYFFRRRSGAWSLGKTGEDGGTSVGVQVQAVVPTGGDGFGTRVAIDGDTAVVGAPGQPPTEQDAGTPGVVYVYASNPDGTWSEIDVLAPPDGSPGDQFGTELAVSSNTIVVGAPGADATGIDAGAAYVFSRDSGHFRLKQQLLPNSKKATETLLGWGSIGLDGNLLVVPALGGPAGAQAQAYAADGSGTFTEVPFDAPPGQSEQASAQWRTAIRGTTAIVAARVSVNAGIGFVYRRIAGTWQFEKRLLSATSPEDEVFGWTVAYDGYTACFGAIFFRGQEGAVYVFDIAP